MKTPVEIAAIARLNLEGGLSSDHAWARNIFALDGQPHHGDCTNFPATCTQCLIDEERRKTRGQIADLEAAGYVIAHPDQVTAGMVSTVGERAFKTPRAFKTFISAALRAAPKWSKGSEGR